MGQVAHEINNLSNRIGNMRGQELAHEENMLGLGLQREQMNNEMMGLSAERALKVAQAERDKYLDEPVLLQDAINTSKMPEDRKKAMLSTLPKDLLSLPTTRRKAVEAYNSLAAEQRQTKLEKEKMAATERIAGMRAGGAGADPYYTPIQTSTGVVSFNNRNGTVAPLVSGDNAPLLPVSADVDLAGNKKAAQERAKNNEEKRARLPKVKATYDTLNAQWDMVDDKIDEAINAVGPFTAGAGAWAASIPATPQRDLRETLTTIKSNIGFDKLQEMRENSPTGGALGQVSDTENLLLQAVQGSLDQGQSPAQLQKNLKLIKKNLNRLRTQKEIAFQTDYGQLDAQPQAAPPNTSAPPPPPPPPTQSAMPPVEGAKQAPDGNWYIEQNGRYFKVEQ